MTTESISKTPLERAQDRRREMREQGITVERLNPIERLAKNPTSLRLAINAKCFDCEGGDADPNVQKRIGTCGIVMCPLHAVRPYQRRDDAEPTDET